MILASRRGSIVNILGKNFIGPEEIMEARSVLYNDEQLLELERTMPSNEVICWYRRHNYGIVAGPPKEMSLMDLRDEKAGSLDAAKLRKYVGNKHPFVVNDKVGCHWVACRKAEIPKSICCTLAHQVTLRETGELTPNAPTMAWFMMMYQEINQVRLFPTIHVRTSSTDKEGKRIVISYGRVGGVRLSPFGDHEARRDVGLAGYLKIEKP